MKKQYDYWLVVWIDKKDEEIHQPVNFQKGVHPKDWCEEIMKSGATDGNGNKVKDFYKSYALYPLTLQKGE